MITNSFTLETLELNKKHLLELQGWIKCYMEQEEPFELNPEGIRNMTKLKMQRFPEGFQDKPFVKIDTELSSAEYKHRMFELFIFLLREAENTYKEQLIDIDKISTNKTSELADYMEDIITPTEIVNNKIDKQIRVNRKRIGKGAKLTRVMSQIANHVSSILDTKIVGNFNSLPGKAKDIYIYANPLAAVAAGMIGDSCFSPGSENDWSVFESMSYEHIFVAADYDFSWRVFISVDAQNKEVGIHAGYPRENYYNQMRLRKYFKDLGYKIVPTETFRSVSPAYWSFDDIESIFAEELSVFEIPERNHLTVRKHFGKGLHMLIDPKYTDSFAGTSSEEEYITFNADIEVDAPYCEVMQRYMFNDIVKYYPILDLSISDAIVEDTDTMRILIGDRIQEVLRTIDAVTTSYGYSPFAANLLPLFTELIYSNLEIEADILLNNIVYTAIETQIGIIDDMDIENISKDTLGQLSN